MCHPITELSQTTLDRSFASTLRRSLIRARETTVNIHNQRDQLIDQLVPSNSGGIPFGISSCFLTSFGFVVYRPR